MIRLAISYDSLGADGVEGSGDDHHDGDGHRKGTTTRIHRARRDAKALLKRLYKSPESPYIDLILEGKDVLQYSVLCVDGIFESKTDRRSKRVKGEGEKKLVIGNVDMK